MKKRNPMKKGRIAGFLITWFILATVVYMLGIQRAWEWILYVYGGIVLVFGALFLLVNGGIGPLRDKEEEKPRLKVFNQGEDTRIFWAQVLLIIVMPPIVLLLGDYTYLLVTEYFM
ncbi:MAG TPA: hypothetical protein DCY74_07205 [Clostridiales bacterium]|jgi:predicted membrane protein|nr:hypothetical protein [Clostridiales bacterium]HCG35276.1 hypothetical protein [Clostridiales bacterium]